MLPFADTIFVACSDSRVVPDTFASTDPGDLFVLRNPGNIIPREDASQVPAAAGAAAAIEFAVRRLGVTEAVVCGHSDCGVMKAMAAGTERGFGPLATWLQASGAGCGSPHPRPSGSGQRARPA